MFIRKKPNKSGSVSVQIIDKSDGYRVVKTVGSSKDPKKVVAFVHKAERIIRTSDGRQGELFSIRSPEESMVRGYLEGLANKQIHVVGPEAVFGKLFDRLGFCAIPEELFRHIVIARLAYPVSKLKTVDYLYRYEGVGVEVGRIYRFLDRLNERYKDTVERLAFEYSRKVLQQVSVVFYDMTTLYFEAEDEDDLRKIGFSKDGKFQHPQIMLGLFVGEGGYPIGYDIYEGNVFEGHTLLPALERVRERFGLGHPVVVADAGLLSRKNIELLEAKGHSYILGARIKNEADDVKTAILLHAGRLKDGEGFEIRRLDGSRLIVTYSDQRRKKDAYARERGLVKLRKKIGRLTKQHINNRGYNKFLTLTGDVQVSIDEDMVKADSLWDGLKGYITNTDMPIEKVVENYRHLWQIEKAFRISKTDLRIRPVYHFRRRRIEAHICVAFVAYTIYKELERLLTEGKAGFSPKRAAELTHTMYALDHNPLDGADSVKIVLKMDSEQQKLYDIIQSSG
jgi:transposase